MYGLLDAATVLNGDGNWTAGYEVDALACGRSIEGYDICTPGAPAVPEDSATGFKIEPFAVVGRQKFGTRCTPDEADAALTDAMSKASEYVVAKNFWNGDIADWKGAAEGMFLLHADIVTVAAGADVAASVAAALELAYQNHPEIEPIVHLGLSAALQLGPSKLDDFDVNYAVSPGYPINGVAVTGPIVVRLGSVETLKSHDTSVNRVYISGTRLAAVEFDPCLVVRVA